MAEESIPRQLFHCRDLATKSVTLYPSRAHIVREIPNITLQPGQNEVEIYGLGPMVDEDSVQIEGRGQATITDITIDLVPNRDDFLEQFPDESDESDDDDDDDDSDDEAPEAVKRIEQEIEEILAKIDATQELENSAIQQLQTLDHHVGTMNAKDHDATSASSVLNMYSKERERIQAVRTTAVSDSKKLNEKLEKKQREKVKANKETMKKKLKLEKVKEKAREKKARQKADKREEAARVRKEREKFWPTKVYKVVVRLETALDTPGSSRRNSLDSVTLAKATPEDLDKLKATPPSRLEVSLSISYITDSAFWTPRYDFNIHTVQKSATIVYRAQLSNGTSETWKDAKIILSTSQTSYSGLDDKVPIMHPWRVRLGKAWEVSNSIQSGEELARASVNQAKSKSKAKRLNMGINGSRQVHSAPAPAGMQPQQAMQSQVQLQRNYVPSQVVGTVFRSNDQPGAAGGGDRGWLAQSRRRSGQADKEGGDASFGGADMQVAAFTVEDADDSQALDFEESAWEDYGLTATYDLPGSRTLAPSSLGRRHKIATLNATNILLSHIAVPKLKQSAYLRCKIRNPSSSVTLLKGQAGITLDGSFLGTTALERISPSQVFTIPLGVDPAIHISYPKPTSHRSTAGIFSKENTTLYSRSTFITNTKATPVQLLVLDQVPVSQDEKLRVEIVEPKGLYKSEDSVKAGAAATETKTPWGKASATLKKEGEISWMVNIEKGQSCLLKLGYETKLPSNDAVVAV